MLQTRARDIEALLLQVFGRPITLAVDAPARPESQGAPLTEHPLIKQVVEVFGARLVHVEPRQRPDA